MPKRRTILLAGSAALALAPARVWPAEGGKQVTANEDLMREHGVLRRALMVYTVAAERLNEIGHADLHPELLARTARLFRSFGEDYHERKLEEQHIFPAVRKIAGKVADYPDILQQQHERGRELTDYVLQVTRGGNIASINMDPLAQALQEFVSMYRIHAALEDTEVFPAWKESLSPRAYAEMGERFEQIERQAFGKDGFDEALKQITAIEQQFGMPTLSGVTMPAPPKPGA
ncbi:hemerythrin domain-containing protein [Massilia terrae]|uniref:Hemerythrin domain-containing protein n=1 Tax=Massilia terrae TaxID=1811224 RepID=A0ABT2CYY8_9BURK|nr:hemerythrin domain-containing protein [Massilia terrae]MCS0659074.1 hemerythrin domain-containing protein [Massilia terrae]